MLRRTAKLIQAAGKRSRSARRIGVARRTSPAARGRTTRILRGSSVAGTRSLGRGARRDGIHRGASDSDGADLAAVAGVRRRARRVLRQRERLPVAEEWIGVKVAVAGDADFVVVDAV